MDTPSILSLERYLPSGIVRQRNPLFDLLLRRMRWPRGLSADELMIANSSEIRTAKIRSLKRYTRRYALIFPCVLAVIGVYLLFHRNNRYSYYNDTGVLIILLSIVGALGFSLLCDLYYAVVAINTITRQSRLEQWELLRLTKLSERDILLATCAMIQIRAWRLAVVEVGIRVCLSGILLLELLNSGVSSTDFLLGFLLFLVLIIGYTLEPLWRMRTITLIGVTITTWVTGYATAVLTSIAALFGLLLLRIGVLIAAFWIFLLILQPAFENYERLSEMGDYSRTLLIEQFVLVVFSVGTMYMFLKGVQRATFGFLNIVAFRS